MTALDFFSSLQNQLNLTISPKTVKILSYTPSPKLIETALLNRQELIDFMNHKKNANEYIFLTYSFNNVWYFEALNNNLLEDGKLYYVNNKVIYTYF